MGAYFNCFVDFLADFPYRKDWTRDPSIELPGKEVSELLVSGLRKRLIEVKSVRPVDYGHFIECSSGGRRFEIAISVDDHQEMQRWAVNCYPREGVLTKLLRGTPRSNGAGCYPQYTRHLPPLHGSTACGGSLATTRHGVLSLAKLQPPHSRGSRRKEAVMLPSGIATSTGKRKASIIDDPGGGRVGEGWGVSCGATTSLERGLRCLDFGWVDPSLVVWARPTSLPLGAARTPRAVRARATPRRTKAGSGPPETRTRSAARTVSPMDHRR